MGRAEALIALRQALSVDPELELLEEPGELQRHSRDAFEYSPVLTPRLEACRADLVVRPRTVDAVERLASACAEHFKTRQAQTGQHLFPFHPGGIQTGHQQVSTGGELTRQRRQCIPLGGN